MITQNDIARLAGADVYDTDGDKVGSVGEVYLDAQGGDPKWVTVRTGLFGTKETFVPLQAASYSGDRITVSYPKGKIKDAPRIDADGAVSPAEEVELYTYYGLRDSGNAEGRHAAGYDDSYHDSTGDSGSMTRSEEKLVADTRTEEVGKARLRKYVVTEQQSVSVPVAREEVRLEREPITDANAGDAYDGPEITEAEHEVTLRAERPVVNTEAVPVERVRLGTETVRDEETVSGQVRKEQIEFDGDKGRDRR
ncbi:DUF2382 domain-containing protein [Actinoplanes sp. CA-015351]|uniref:DUF2382 domain-containing protein n=1 Tax=Actinoplanes sp. CA-015351 TaxID=3239897 RepID=UPI003D996AF4